jgi:hypothetical protein
MKDIHSNNTLDRQLSNKVKDFYEKNKTELLVEDIASTRPDFDIAFETLSDIISIIETNIIDIERCALKIKNNQEIEKLQNEEVKEEPTSSMHIFIKNKIYLLSKLNDRLSLLSDHLKQTIGRI